jgi:biopolymer transport protein ExbD
LRKVFRAVLLAALVLALAFLIAIRVLPRHSNGLRVRVASDTCDCREVQPILLHISSNGGLSINSESVELSGLATRLADIYSTHPVRVLYLSSDADAPFQWVVDIIATVQHSTIKALSGPGEVPLPKELRGGLPGTLNIEVRLVTPSAARHCYGIITLITNRL